MYNTIIGVFAKPLGMLLSLLYGFIGNYGFTLLALTLIVKCCLYPLYAKQIKSTVNMSKIQPKIQELQRKYANDKETLNIKMMELYKEEKFNPMGGCLPMLIQMPIIFGLFALLRDPMSFMHGTTMLMAIHESFFWIMDLSQPDPWILPFAAGITTYISSAQSQAQQGNNAANQQMSAMMNMMKYFLPLMIIWMGRSFPAGLTIYWFFGTLIQIFFNLHLNKIRKQLSGGNEKKK